MQVYGERRTRTVHQQVSIWAGKGPQWWGGWRRGRTEEEHTVKPIVMHILPVTKDNGYVGQKRSHSFRAQLMGLSGKHVEGTFL